MADDTKGATVRSVVSRQGSNPEVNRGPTFVDTTVPVSAGADEGSVYTMLRVPTNARINGSSRVWITGSQDDSEAPTLDIGLAPVDGNFGAAVTDALNDGLSLYAAGNLLPLLGEHADHGLQVWQLAGLASDPGGFADIIGTIMDDDVVDAGRVTMTVHYHAN